MAKAFVSLLLSRIAFISNNTAVLSMYDELPFWSVVAVGIFSLQSLMLA